MRYRLLGEAPHLDFVRSEFYLITLKNSQLNPFGNGRRRGSNYAAGSGPLM